MPRSRTARRRLWLVLGCGGALTLAVALTLAGLSQSLSYFYTPSEALARAPLRARIELGGRVEPGSVRWRGADGVAFQIGDRHRRIDVVYRGELPDLFREGQAVIAGGAFIRAGQFEATRILAKHDERYTPSRLAG